MHVESLQITLAFESAFAYILFLSYCCCKKKTFCYKYSCLQSIERSHPQCRISKIHHHRSSNCHNIPRKFSCFWLQLKLQCQLLSAFMKSVKMFFFSFRRVTQQRVNIFYALHVETHDCLICVTN